MERCERFEELLSQRLDQPLLPEEERELEDHLAAAAELADSCGLTSEEVVETLRALLEEHNL